ncbi:MAG: restriction endonuclease [Cyanobacteria bacterium P01_D01_bin.56]
MPRPNSLDWKALKDKHQYPALSRTRSKAARPQRQLFPIPTAVEAERDARAVLSNLRQQVHNVTADQRRSLAFGALRTISPFTFEYAVILCFRELGYKTGDPTFKNDGGIDGKIIDHDGATILLQTKRYGPGESRYLVKHLRDYITVVERYTAQGDAIGGFFLHSGRTGLDARLLADATDGLVTLFSGDILLDLLLHTAS